MTPSQAAQEKFTSPRTDLFDANISAAWAAMRNDVLTPDGPPFAAPVADLFRAGRHNVEAAYEAKIAAVREAAAATPSLDSRLRDFVSAYFDTVDGDGTPAEVYTAEQDMRKAWERVVNPALAARLDEGSATPDRTHPDAGNIEANHYDRFTAGEAAYVLDNLDAWRAKYEEALTDPFVHDHAKVALVLIDAIRAQGKREPR